MLILLYVLFFGSEGSALTLSPFHLLPRFTVLSDCSSTMTKEHFLVICYGTKWPLCTFKPTFVHSVPKCM